MIHRFLVVLLALAALGSVTQYAAAEDPHADAPIREETVDPVDPAAGERPNLSPEAFEKIFSKLSNKCQKEIEANPTDPEKLSERCRAELGRKVQRHLEREKLGGEKKEKKPKTQQQSKPKKPKTKKNRKQSRAQREAAAANKQEEDYNQAVTIIGGFVATLIAVVLGAMCIINRKLKAAGMYYPANPEERASCCG